MEARFAKVSRWAGKTGRRTYFNEETDSSTDEGWVVRGQKRKPAKTMEQAG